MEYRRGIMKTSLAENLRVLMTRKMFEKITIKQICDETGVIRATFYNYFDDKYDCLNWIVHMDLLVNDENLKNTTFNAYFDKVLTKIDENRDFYRSAYNVIGQNSFEDMVRNNLRLNLNEYLKYHRNPSTLPQYDNNLLSRYYAESIAFIIKDFVFNGKGMDISYFRKMTLDLLSHSFQDYEQ